MVAYHLAESQSLASYTLRCNFWCLIGMETQHFYKKRYFKNKASVALNPLVSVIGRLVACSGRKRGNRQTDGRMDGMTKQLYCNPRCACAPRVNDHTLQG